MHFAHAEKLVIKIIVTLFVMVAGLAFVKGVYIDILKFDFVFAFCMAFVLIGQFYRKVRIHEPLAASATVIGLSLLLAQVGAALSYMYLPYVSFGFDEQLAVMDASIGFVWRDFAISFVDKPAVVEALRVVYNSSFNQIIGMILVLGLTSRVRDLHTFMLTLVIGVLICISLWALFPSSSPVGFQPLPLDVAAKLNLTLNPEVGAELVRLAHEGLTSYPPEKYEGLVGFPSFHTVMLLSTVYIARNIRLLFFPVLLWNLAMFPAVLLHGAHNLVDVYAGIAVAVVSIYFTNKFMAADPAHQIPQTNIKPNDQVGIPVA